jgi:8-oxo-dGTP diphosphatase
MPYHNNMPRSDQGVFFNRYQLIPRTLIFLTREETVLLIKGAADKRLWENRYNGVGGHIERGEDVLAAAHRELVEETGLNVSALWLCGTITVDTGEEVGIGIYVFQGECPSGAPASSEEGSLSWIPFSEIHEIDLVDDLHILLPRVLEMSQKSPPFSAHYSYDEAEKIVVRFFEVT